LSKAVSRTLLDRQNDRDPDKRDEHQDETANEADHFATIGERRNSTKEIIDGPS
jgi:hypothetical protein